MKKINCSDCSYYHVVESWKKDGKAWCRVAEAKVKLDNQKTRCKYFKSIESVTTKSK